MNKKVTLEICCWTMFFGLLAMLSQPCFANDEAELDPIAFSISANKTQVKLGEEFEIRVIASKRNNFDTRLGYSNLDTDFKLKVVFPKGFEQTGGTYSDFVGEALQGQKKSAVYTIKGRFTEKVSSTTFVLLRGSRQSVELGRYLYRGQVNVEIADNFSTANKSFSQESINCSGYTFSDGQIIGATSVNIIIQINSGCAVAYWQGGVAAGQRANKDWISQLSGKTIPDNILLSCVKWEGDVLNCSNCTTPSAPSIAKTAGTTVCSSTNQQVTLTASGCTGTVTWFRDGVQVASGTTYSTSTPSNYTAKCTVGSCVSTPSSSITVLQTSGCGVTTSLSPTLSIWKAGVSGVRTKISDLSQGQQIQKSGKQSPVSIFQG
ncbi:MAG TPA: hypothetical protein VGN64_21770 [Dyadobacter sp.]|jgi:hypothetical protein|nr:hypothetical protein [Dyadobacter sp.]